MTTKDQIAIAKLYNESFDDYHGGHNGPTDGGQYDDDDNNHIKLSGSFEDTELYQELKQDREYLRGLVKAIDKNSNNEYGYRDDLLEQYYDFLRPYLNKVEQIPNNYLDSNYYIRYFENLTY